MNWWDAIRGFLLEQSLIFRSYQALEWSVVWMQIWRLSNYYAVSNQSLCMMCMCTMTILYSMPVSWRAEACFSHARIRSSDERDAIEAKRSWAQRSAKQATRCYKMLQDATSKKRTESFGNRKWTFHTAGHPEQHILPLHYNFAVCIALKQVAIASWKAPAWCSWMAKCQLALGGQRSSYGNTVPGKNAMIPSSNAPQT